MGGYGSGNWYRWDSKATTDSQHGVDIRWLKQQRCLVPGYFGSITWSRRGEETGSIMYRVENDRIVLIYRHRPHDGDWEKVEQEVYFDQTPCNYGGYRKFFKCPHCWQRVAVLYGVGKYFLCRHCYNLTYQSQQNSKADRLMEKARNIIIRLGGGVSLLDPFPEKPKGMHWKTYYRFQAESMRLELQGWTLAESRLGLLGG